MNFVRKQGLSKVTYDKLSIEYKSCAREIDIKLSFCLHLNIIPRFVCFHTITQKRKQIYICLCRNFMLTKPRKFHQRKRIKRFDYAKTLIRYSKDNNKTPNITPKYCRTPQKSHSLYFQSWSLFQLFLLAFLQVALLNIVQVAFVIAHPIQKNESAESLW